MNFMRDQGVSRRKRSYEHRSIWGVICIWFRFEFVQIYLMTLLKKQHKRQQNLCFFRQQILTQSGKRKTSKIGQRAIYNDDRWSSNSTRAASKERSWRESASTFQTGDLIRCFLSKNYRVAEYNWFYAHLLVPHCWW